MPRTITPNDLKPLVEKKSVIVVDVRRKNDLETDPVKLPGAEWKNPELMAEWGMTLPKDKEVVIYCARGGSVSNSVLDHLHGQGALYRRWYRGMEGGAWDCDAKINSRPEG